MPVDWSSERGQLLVNGRPFHLKGRCVRMSLECKGGRAASSVNMTHEALIPQLTPTRAAPIGSNWFGFETNTFFPHGLWGAATMDRVFQFMRENGFNALRVPFSAELALNPGRVVRVEDPALDNLGNIDRLARFVDVAARYDILVRERMLFRMVRRRAGPAISIVAQSACSIRTSLSLPRLRGYGPVCLSSPPPTQPITVDHDGHAPA